MVYITISVTKDGTNEPMVASRIIENGKEVQHPVVLFLLQPDGSPLVVSSLVRPADALKLVQHLAGYIQTTTGRLSDILVEHSREPSVDN